MSNIQKGYKQTDVGVIPEDWDVRSISSVAEIATGNTPPTRDLNNYGDEYLFVGPADLGKRKWIFNSEKKLSRKGFNISRKFPPKSILFTCIGSTIGKSGMASILLTSNQQINAVLPNENYHSDFLFYALNLLSPKIKSLAGEQAVPLVNKTQFGETLVPLPPTKSEQTAIASALSDADALITSLEKLIEKKRAIKQGAMQKCLNPDSYYLYDDTDSKPHQGNQANQKNHSSDKWVVKKLGEILKIRHGKSQKEVEDSNGQYPILGTGGLMSYTNHFLYDKPSVLIGRKGTIDKPQFMDSPFWTVDTLFYTEINADVSPKFIYYRFLLVDWYSHNEASGVPSLNAKTIENIEISIPSFSEQTRIASILTDMDAEITTLEQKLSKYKLLKQGMMQELLTGKIRLVDYERIVNTSEIDSIEMNN